MSDIRKEFDEAFEKIVDNFISTDYDRDDQACGEIVDKEGLALWAAVWMANRCAKEIHYQSLEEKWAPDSLGGKGLDYLIGSIIKQRSKEIRQLAKELEESK